MERRGGCNWSAAADLGPAAFNRSVIEKQDSLPCSSSTNIRNTGTSSELRIGTDRYEVVFVVALALVLYIIIERATRCFATALCEMLRRVRRGGGWGVRAPGAVRYRGVACGCRGCITVAVGVQCTGIYGEDWVCFCGDGKIRQENYPSTNHGNCEFC